ncbi:BMP family ABC transporter substrate-binding protein [Candidatus Ozemobacteraceae bacterium]|nr:BMP family ABC transporter substrate-binding protein [Candidatus Ozemobacteraceae bacterium]
MSGERNGEKRPRIGSGLLTLTVWAVLAALVLMTGCGEPKPATAKKVRIGLMITPQGLNDQGFNDQAHDGIKAAEKKYGIEAVIIEPATMKDPEASLRFFAAQPLDAIIVVGMAFQKAIRKVSAEHPQLKFFAVDSDVDEGNIKGVAFREHEGSFLCGYLAATFSKNRKIGFVGGHNISVIDRFRRGFHAGAAFAASGTQVVDRFVARDFSGFNKPDAAKKIALDLYNSGCDVIYHAAGASGLGVIAAAVEARKNVIGVDRNQDGMAPGLVLTSMMKRVDLVVEELVKDIVNSEGEKKGVKRSYGIAEGAISLTEFQFSSQQLGETLVNELGELSRQIVAGKLETDPGTAAYPLAEDALPEIASSGPEIDVASPAGN